MAEQDCLRLNTKEVGGVFMECFYRSYHPKGSTVQNTWLKHDRFRQSEDVSRKVVFRSEQKAELLPLKPAHLQDHGVLYDWQ